MPCASQEFKTLLLLLRLSFTYACTMSYRQIPSFNWLRVFESAAAHQSFARAAEQLAMSPAAVSQQIKSLESHLRQPLFVRGAHSVTLTDAGKAFLPVVQQSLRSIETTASALFGNPAQQTLSVESSLLFNCSWLAGRLVDYRERYPEVNLQLSTSDDIAGYGNAANCDLQITFGMGPGFSQESDRLFGELLFPVARPDIAAKISSLADLLDYPLIEVSTHRTSWLQFLAQGDADLFDQASFCFADNTILAINMAAGGFGVALARAPASDEVCRNLGLQPCLEKFAIRSPQEYYLLYQSLAGLDKTAAGFRDWLLETIVSEGIDL